MADKIEIKGDAIGSAIGRGARVRSRDITVYRDAVDNSSLDDQLKSLLKRGREALDKADLLPDDKEDAIDDFGKLTAELEKPEQDANRIARYFQRVKELAPSVASILSSATSLATLFGGDVPDQ